MLIKRSSMSKPIDSIVFLLISLLITACASAQETDGFAEPYRELELAASEMGTISKLSVKEGDVVEAGQILASLNDDVLLASLDLAKEAMSAKGKLNSATAELELQRERYKKMVGLRTRRHASQVEVDRAATQLEIAEAQFQAVKEELRLKAIEHRRIQAQLEQRRIKSPISGIVIRVHKDEGEFVSPTDPVVVKVVQLNPLLVVFSIPKEDARELHKNQEVPVYFGDLEVQGVVEFVSPTADAQSGTTRVKIRVPNHDLALQSGDACRLNAETPDAPIASSSDTKTSHVGIRKP